MEIIIKHKRKDAWAGVIKYKSCFDYIVPALTRSGNRHTGLTSEDETRLEKLLNLGVGTLAPYSQYWVTFMVKITNKELVLNTDIPWEELQYLFLRNHHRVSDGISSLNSGADYLLIDKNAEAQESNKVNKRRLDALKEYAKMSLEDMRKCLRLYGYKADTMSSELVENKLVELIEADPSKFYTKWVDNKTKNTEFIISTALAKNIMRKNKNVYYYGTEIIGTSLEDCVSYMDNRANQELKMSIINEIDNK